ncbi:Zinc transporter ZupT [Porphyridium purpureum]|uniref:Zinc transporter ZupT n=1 Tax=Porphyridium purpureum TaxID=35688 RepID=A0A5J4Z5I0_PORPP|nr:Zinc transporter ZupT [Porphyridium purpureum]|eukprot:POR6770..scf295_1
MDTCTPSQDGGNVGLAFGLVTAAGLSTSIGAALAFLAPKKAASARKWLAASLATAAGVMTYVSFVEIFSTKAVDSFAACVDNFGLAYLYATLCFFGGVIITYLLDLFLHWFEHNAPHWKCFARRSHRSENESSERVADPSQLGENMDDVGTDGSVKATDGVDSPTRALENSSSSTPPGLDGVVPDDVIEDASGSRDVLPIVSAPIAQVAALAEAGSYSGDIEPASENPRAESSTSRDLHITEELAHDANFILELQNEGKTAKDLARMGMFAGVALAFHNFPEGLATFVAVLSDSSVGVSVAIAIAIHNIPEGLCVAMPIFYATGSRWKAFFWATMSGLTELVGALLGWLVLKNVLSQVVYGILFGLVAGMMVYVSLKELLPTAHKYDVDDRLTSACFFAGAGVIALSLVLFQL